MGQRSLLYTHIEMKKFTILLVIIIALATLLRFWQLGSIPPSPDWDEASLGYNAYSILHTGRDEYGKQFPIILESFGDYKPALYAYLSIPSIAIFGLSTFSVRLPSAIFGVLTVLAVYFLVKELLSRGQELKEKDPLINENWKLKIPIIAAALLAVSPWHIQFSRVAFETNVGVALSVFAALFFLYGLRRNRLLLLSAAFFGVELYAYQSDKVFAPLLLFVLVVIYFRKLLRVQKRYLIGAILIGLLVSFPMAFSVLSNSTTLSRAASVSIFSGQSDDFARNADKLLLDHQRHDILGLLLDNRRVLFAREIVANYISHWDLNWLYVKGDIPRHHAPGMGLLYLVMAPFLFIGFYKLLFGRYPKRMRFTLLAWFLIAPIPASITTGVPHAVRTMHFLPAITIIEAIGVAAAWQQISKIKYQPFGVNQGKRSKINVGHILIAACCLLFAFNFVYYMDQYFVQLNYFDSEDWQYGYKQAVADVTKLAPQYNKIVFSNNGYLDQSYIFYLFYSKYPPRLYQKQMQFIGNSTSDRTFGKFEFRHFNWSDEHKAPGVLYIGMPKEFPDNTPAVDTINYLDGKPAIKIIGT